MTFNIIFQPFSASTKPSYQTLLILISFTWIFSLLLALIPFSTSLQYIFTDRAVIQHNPFFRNVVVDFDSAKNWAERLLTFEPELRNTTVDVVYRIRGATTWSGLKDLLGNIRLAELLEPSGYMRSDDELHTRKIKTNFLKFASLITPLFQVKLHISNCFYSDITA